MDADDLRAILLRSKVEIWAMLDAVIRVASSDHAEEFRRRRDGIVESLYAPVSQLCQNCTGDDGGAAQDHRLYHDTNTNIDNNNSVNTNSCDDDDGDENYQSNRNIDEDHSKVPLTPESNHDFGGGESEDDVDPIAALFEDEPATILSIKEQLEDPDQSEDDVIGLLQNLADMDITFQALKETDIGRHVNRLRKHPSNEVRRIVKQLVRKWKDTVDEWVRVNQPQGASNLIADVDSPQQNIPKYQQNGHNQQVNIKVPDFGYSPNPNVGSSSAERNYVDHETKPKPSQSIPRRETTSRPLQSAPKSAGTLPPPNRAPQREPAMDDARLNSARRRLQENYQEAQNAKKQRTIQVMDIHDLPKPKNAFFAKNKGGGGFQGRNRR